MRSKRTFLKNSRLYLILDREVHDYRKLFQIAKQAIRWGVDILQLRDKKGSASEILEFSKTLVRLSRDKALFIVNDRVDIAKMCKADGVHLGQEDLPIAEARKLLGASAIIGRSCQKLKQASSAVTEGADYIGFGSVFKTLTKPNRNPMDLKILKNVLQKTPIPVFCIGGIDLKKLEVIGPLGCRRIAVCRDICLASDIKKLVTDYNKKLSEY